MIAIIYHKINSNNNKNKNNVKISKTNNYKMVIMITTIIIKISTLIITK